MGFYSSSGAVKRPVAPTTTIFDQFELLLETPLAHNDIVPAFAFGLSLNVKVTVHT
mgnify:CR=1 FL=1